MAKAERRAKTIAIATIVIDMATAIDMTKL